MTAPTPSSSGSDGPRYDPWAQHPPTGPLPGDPAAAAGGGPAGGRRAGRRPEEGAPSHGAEVRHGREGHAADGGGTPPYTQDLAAPGHGRDTARELREAALAALGVAALGVVLGLLWLWLAPRVPLVSDGNAVYLERPEGEEAIGADGTFVLLGLAVGAVAGGAVFLFRRSGGVGLVLGLTLGGLLGSVIAWRLGVWLGPTDDLAAHARAVGEGTVFDGPLELNAKGALLAYPFGAVLAHLLCTASFGRRDPEPGGRRGPSPQSR